MQLRVGYVGRSAAHSVVGNRRTASATSARKGALLFECMRHLEGNADNCVLQDILSKDKNARVITAGDFNEVSDHFEFGVGPCDAKC
jgi:hypothetical protein